VKTYLEFSARSEPVIMRTPANLDGAKWNCVRRALSGGQF